jgi:glucose-1-phosphate adenylyltransferase
LDRNNGGVTVLPPYEKSSNTDWYTGTANAIYQNMEYMEQYNPDYVLILSGDHIYKMDYEVMLDFHKANKADCTIAVMPVPMEEASRFGIIVAEENGRISEFQEKPAQPKSNLASMGIYIFSYDVLRQYLVEDDQKADSNHDFGKDIIPALLNTGKKCLAYRFEGYWKDVGTIDSLWEANMDLLNPENILDLADPSWKIYTEDVNELPQFIGATGSVDNAYITEGCVVDGEVKNSVLFTNVKVEEGAQVIDSVVMPNCVVKAGAKLVRCLVQENTIIPEGVELGQENGDKIDLITYKNAKKEG